MAESLVTAAELVVKAIRDDHSHGDLLSRKTIQAAIVLEQLLESNVDVRKAALEEFALFLLEHRPSAVQIKISPDYNAAVLAAFGWAANEARKLSRLK